MLSALFAVACAPLPPEAVDGVEAALSSQADGQVDATLGLASSLYDSSAIERLDFEAILDGGDVVDADHPLCAFVPAPEDVVLMHSDCPRVNGWSWKMDMYTCAVGEPELFAGSVVFTFEELSGLSARAPWEEVQAAIDADAALAASGLATVYYDVSGVTGDGSDVAICERRSGTLWRQSNTSSGEIVGADGTEVSFTGRGTTRIIDNGSRAVMSREGRSETRVVSGSNVYVATATFSDLRQDMRGGFPVDGLVTLDSSEGSTSVEFGPFSQRSGNVIVTDMDGVESVERLR